MPIAVVALLIVRSKTSVQSHLVDEMCSRMTMIGTESALRMRGMFLVVDKGGKGALVRNMPAEREDGCARMLCYPDTKSNPGVTPVNAHGQ